MDAVSHSPRTTFSYSPELCAWAEWVRSSTTGMLNRRCTICSVCEPRSAIRSVQKPVFHRYLPTRCAYNTRRCLDLEIWRFSCRRQPGKHRSRMRLINDRYTACIGVGVDKWRTNTVNRPTMHRWRMKSKWCGGGRTSRERLRVRVRYARSARTRDCTAYLSGTFNVYDSCSQLLVASVSQLCLVPIQYVYLAQQHRDRVFLLESLTSL